MRKVPFKGSPKYYLGNTSTCDLLPSAVIHGVICLIRCQLMPQHAVMPKREMCQLRPRYQKDGKCAWQPMPKRAKNVPVRSLGNERRAARERERQGVQKHDDMPELEMCQHACRHATSPYFSPCHRSQRHKHLQQWAHFDRIVLSLQPTY